MRGVRSYACTPLWCHALTVVRTATGLPLAWYDVLLELARAPDPLRSANSAIASSSAVAGEPVIDDMAARGLVTKEDDPTDRRSAYAALTREGRTRFGSAAAVYLRAIEHEFATTLTTAELRDLTSLLERVIAAKSP